MKEVSTILRKGTKGNDVKELQTQLNALDINAGIVDGIFGSGTEKAVKELQTIFGLDVDGIVGNDTHYVLNTLKKITHFKLSEFKCEGCKELKLNINLLLKLEELRKQTGLLIVNSGYRSPAYNKKVGGHINSEHLRGNAADVKAANMSPDKVHAIADKIFNGVGKYNTFTHVDMGVKRLRWNG